MPPGAPSVCPAPSWPCAYAPPVGLCVPANLPSQVSLECDFRQDQTADEMPTQGCAGWRKTPRPRRHRTLFLTERGPALVQEVSSWRFGDCKESLKCPDLAYLCHCRTLTQGNDLTEALKNDIQPIPVYRCIIHNQDLEATEVSVDGCMGTEATSSQWGVIQPGEGRKSCHSCHPNRP